VKKVRSAFLGILSFSIVLILAAGCFRPAAPDVTPTPSGGGGGTSPGGTDLEATAIANSTRAAQTLEAQTAEAETAPTEEPTETTPQPPATATPVPATWTPTVAAATPVPTTAPTAAPSVTGETTHVVPAGETVFQIALQYGTTVEAIVQANGIVDATQIYAGQVLTIPAGTQPTQPPTTATTHVVQPGENLFRIALRYGLSYQRLAEYNGITDPSSIYVGQVLQIPPQ
jgi:LysM repeat protein